MNNAKTQQNAETEECYIVIDRDGTEIFAAQTFLSAKLFADDQTSLADDEDTWFTVYDNRRKVCVYDGDKEYCGTYLIPHAEEDCRCEKCMVHSGLAEE